MGAGTTAAAAGGRTARMAMAMAVGDPRYVPRRTFAGTMLPTVPKPRATRLVTRAASNSRTPERCTGVPLSLVTL